jgi:hypothetical protein
LESSSDDEKKESIEHVHLAAQNEQKNNEEMGKEKTQPTYIYTINNAKINYFKAKRFECK